MSTKALSSPDGACADNCAITDGDGGLEKRTPMDAAVWQGRFYPARPLADSGRVLESDLRIVQKVIDESLLVELVVLFGTGISYYGEATVGGVIALVAVAIYGGWAGVDKLRCRFGIAAPGRDINTIDINTLTDHSD